MAAAQQPSYLALYESATATAQTTRTFLIAYKAWVYWLTDTVLYSSHLLCLMTFVVNGMSLVCAATAAGAGCDRIGVGNVAVTPFAS